MIEVREESKREEVEEVEDGKAEVRVVEKTRDRRKVGPKNKEGVGWEERGGGGCGGGG